MARLISINLTDERLNEDTPIYYVRLMLAGSDLVSFGGVMGLTAAHELAQASIDKAKAGFQYRRALGYSLFYREWMDPESIIIREAELEVRVI